jgi:hypothetical protein
VYGSGGSGGVATGKANNVGGAGSRGVIVIEY